MQLFMSFDNEDLASEILMNFSQGKLYSKENEGIILSKLINEDLVLLK